MMVFFIAMTAVAGVGCYLTERVDRPRRRAEKLASMTPAE